MPIDYEPARPGAAYPRALGVGADYVRRFWALWKLRNSILAADYDDRAHDSAIWLQRYWQRQRFKHITELVQGQGRVLDVGCGSSRIIGALVKDSVCIDILRRKLRYARRFGRPLVHGSGFTLPVPDASFPCVLCSQVIEHVPKESPILTELDRALAPGGRLVLGTPDYARWEWVVTEKLYGWAAPGGYADEHIGHYTREELIARYTGMGWTHEDDALHPARRADPRVPQAAIVSRTAHDVAPGPPLSRVPVSALLVALAGLGAGILAAGISYDDAWITYRYAYNLAAGDGFVYNTGERVFGTSAPGYALVLALLSLPNPEWVPTVSAGLCVLSLVAAARRSRRSARSAGPRSPAWSPGWCSW